MSDIGHSDYCPVNNIGDLEDCEYCMAEYERQAAYYGALYRQQPTEEEIMDAYSHPTEYQKRERMLQWLQK